MMPALYAYLFVAALLGFSLAYANRYTDYPLPTSGLVVWPLLWPLIVLCCVAAVMIAVIEQIGSEE